MTEQRNCAAATYACMVLGIHLVEMINKGVEKAAAALPATDLVVSWARVERELFCFRLDQSWSSRGSSFYRLSWSFGDQR